MTTSIGQLFIVATPIGNRLDITLRALEILKSVDTILCEDTRHSRKLCEFHSIQTPLKAFHAHNENSDTEKIINKLLQGEQLALISDAGTPLISDPGFPLVSRAHDENIRVIPVPGACAITCLLCAAGLSTDNFQFHGFLPAKSAQRLEKLNQIKPLNHTSVIYESSHRIAASLQDMQTVFGDQKTIAIGRELTKKFETISLGNIAAHISKLKEDAMQLKGEFVIAIEKNPQQQAVLDESAYQLIHALKPLLPPKKIAKIVAKQYAVDTREVYQILVDDN